jgi:hypothetical protein
MNPQKFIIANAVDEFNIKSQGQRKLATTGFYEKNKQS